MRVLIATVLLAAIPLVASAHAIGASVEKINGDYLIDVGYDPPQIQAGDRLILDFDLKSSKDKTRVPYDYVWVRVEQNDHTLIATGVARAPLGPTTLLFQLLPNVTSDLIVSTRFERGDEMLVENEVTFKVGGVTNSFLSSPYVLFTFGLLIGAAVMFGMRAKRPS